MRLDPDGAEHFPAVFSDRSVAGLARLFAELSARRPGLRLRHAAGLDALIGPANRIVRERLGTKAQPVRATLFDKSPTSNWGLGWHQDRTIAVRARVDQPGFVDWTVKSGIVHVMPPFPLLERMITARIHLDPVTDDNGPLRIAPGTHRFGRIEEDRIEAIVAQAGERSCLADAGDLWIYATPILHASRRASRPRRRRVLQLLYSVDTLPGGLEWLGI